MTKAVKEENQQAPAEAQFMIQRIYIKNLSFETTNTPAIFQQRWEPELTVDLNTQHQQLDDGVYEVSLTVTATVKNQNATAFLAEVQQAGIFTIKGAGAPPIRTFIRQLLP